MTNCTQDEIIAMAKEAGFANAVWPSQFVSPFERFAALVAAKEREACAQVCESWDDPRNYAAAIRARGTKEGA